MSEHESHAFTFGLVSAAAIVGFMLSPLLPFIDIASLSMVGPMLAVGVAGVWWHIDTPPQTKAGWVLPLAFLAGGVGLFTTLVADAQQSVRRNDNRCAAIQRMMLAPKPIRDDGPDLFQALGCRPQNLPFTEWPTKVKRNPRPVAGG